MLNCFGKTLLCLIFFPLFFWGCMPYGICSVIFLVLRNSGILRLVSMMLYNLAYCVLLFLSLVGINCFGCNRMIQICGCKVIGGEISFH